MRVFKLYFLVAIFFQVACKTYYQVPKRYERERLNMLKAIADTMKNREHAERYLYAMTHNDKGEGCLQFKNNFFKDKNIRPNYKGNLVIVEDWMNSDGGIKTCRINYQFEDSIYYYSDGALSSVENINYVPIVYINGLEYKSDSDTITKYIGFSKFSYSDVMIIKNGRVSKYFNYNTDEYYFLQKGQKKFKTVLISHEELWNLFYKNEVSPNIE